MTLPFSRANQRLLLLFVAVVLVPSSVLIFLGTRTVRQSHELDLKRAAENRALTTLQLRQTLVARLEAIKARALSRESRVSGRTRSQDTAVKLIAPIAGARLMLPWEAALTRPAPSLRYVAAVQAGENAEFRRRNYVQAASSFSSAIRFAVNDADAGTARLGAARSFAKGGQNSAAREQYLAILAQPPDVLDAAGIPFTLYAASALIRSDGRAVVNRLAAVFDAPCCLSPEALFLLRSVVDTAAQIGELSQAERSGGLLRLRQMTAETQQAIGLKQQVAIGAITPSVTRRWLTFGEQLWFVSSDISPTGNAAVVIALDAKTVLAGLSRTKPTLSLLPASESQPNRAVTARLAPDMPAIGIVYPEPTRSGSVAPFYVALLVAVIGIAVFGSSMLWLDVRREVRLAQLRSDFVASVSHELKTPLTAIRMFAETLLLDHSANEDRKQEYLDTIVNESERLTRLLNNVLDLSKMEQGGKTFRLERVPLTDILTRAAQTMRYALSQQDLKLIVCTDERAGSIAANKDSLHQAVLNLLANAIKYSDRGSEIRLSGRIEDGEAIIEVSDDGSGIPAVHRARVTEKFYRVPTEENARIPGTGLGLTLVEHIVQGHDGRLEITSNNGVGTVVRMHLPLTNAS